MVVCALISLYLAFGCAVASAAFGGELFGGLAGLFGLIWLPLLGLAILVQVVDGKPTRKSSQ